MRERDVVDNHAIDASGNFITIKVFELCFPDDFTRIQTPHEPQIDLNKLSFINSDVNRDHLFALRDSQRSNPKIEHGWIQVKTESGVFTINSVLHGTNCGIGMDIKQKKFYETGSILGSECIRIDVIDSFHTHTLVQGTEPEVSNLFSGEDFLSMAYERSKRFWMIGIDGVAYCLINPNEPIYIDEFNTPAYKYGGKFHLGYTYKEAFRDMMDCVNECSLLLFKSADYTNFERVS